MIEKNSIVTFDLSIQQKDRENYYIGNKVVNNYCEVPKIAIQVLNLFDGKRNIQEVSDIIRDTYGVDIDILNFIQNLEDMNLVFSVDGVIIGPKNQTSYSVNIRKLAEIIFGKRRSLIYILLIVLVYIFLIVEEKIPSNNDAIIIEGFTGISIFAFFLVSWSITIVHEFGHYLACVFLDIPTSFSLKLRYFMLVVESDINGVWAVERKKRYLCYMGGIYLESVILLLAAICKVVVRNDVIIKTSSMIIFIITLNYLRQFMLFIRSDLYYVILNFLNLNGLYMYIKEIFFEKKQKVWRNLEKKERISFACFMIISCIGIIFTGIYFMSIFYLYYLYFIQAIHEIQIKDIKYVVDGACALIVMLSSLGLWLVGLKGKVKDRRKSI